MFKTHFIRTVIFAILGGGIGWLIAATSPKIYEASAEMLLGESQVSSAGSVLDPQVQRILDAGVARDAQTELQLLRSQTVFFNAFRAAAEDTNKPDLIANWLEYYLMYDVLSADQRAGQLETGSVASIRVRAHNTDLAERIVGEIANVYNDLRVRNAQNSAANAITYLQSQVNSAKSALDTSETAYKKVAADVGITDVQIAVSSLTSLIQQTEFSLNQINRELEGSRREVATLESELSRVPRMIESSSSTGRNNDVATLESRLADYRAQLEQVRSRYHEDHPRVVEIAAATRKIMAELAEAKKRSLDPAGNTKSLNQTYLATEQALLAATAKRNSLEQQQSNAEGDLQELRARLTTMPATEASLRDKRRDLEVAQNNYIRVKTQLDELENRRETGSRRNTLLSEPRAYREPVAPDQGKFIFIGVIAGICIGLISSFSLESLRPRVQNSRQLAELTGLPVVATVPRLGRSQSRPLSSYAKGTARPQESFKNMAYTMLAKNPGHTPDRIVLFTAVGNAPLRPSSSLQYAIALAATGTKVILVDADGHRSDISKAMGAEARSGLSDIFASTALPAEGANMFVQTEHDNLSLLPIGSDRTRTLADYSTAQIEAFISWVSSQADVVIFDTPPCDLYADASRLVSFADDVTMVVSAASTNYQQIPDGYGILLRAGAKAVNLVLTDASAKDEAFGDAKNYSRAV